MAMEIKGFIRLNSFIRYIDIAVGWPRKDEPEMYYELPGRLIVSDIRDDDSGGLLGIGLVRANESYLYNESICLPVEQAHQLRDALNTLLEDDTTKAADDEV